MSVYWPYHVRTEKSCGCNTFVCECSLTIMWVSYGELLTCMEWVEHTGGKSYACIHECNPSLIIKSFTIETQALETGTVAQPNEIGGLLGISGEKQHGHSSEFLLLCSMLYRFITIWRSFNIQVSHSSVFNCSFALSFIFFLWFSLCIGLDSIRSDISLSTLLHSNAHSRQRKSLTWGNRVTHVDLKVFL